MRVEKWANAFRHFRTHLYVVGCQRSAVGNYQQRGVFEQFTETWSIEYHSTHRTSATTLV